MFTVFLEYYCRQYSTLLVNLALVLVVFLEENAHGAMFTLTDAIFVQEMFSLPSFVAAITCKLDSQMVKFGWPD